MSTSNKKTAHPRANAKKRMWRTGIAASLLISCSPIALHAETNADLAREIAELKAQIREMRGAIRETRGETRRTAAKVAAKGPYVLPPPSNPYPVGAVPAFVTADKKLLFGGITITPGGFIEGASVFRSRNLQADLGSNFGGIPFPNTGLAGTNEFRFSARQSRVALLAEGAVSPTMLAGGYLEMDFQGAAQTANSNQTNSYNPRIRNLYATLDNSEYGLHFLAGQSWSLATLNSKGITPRNEVSPPTIDNSQMPGSFYARQAQVRLVKDFDKKLWIGVSAESPQTTLNGCGVGANGTVINGNNVVCQTTGGSGFNNANSYSINHIPDVIGKVAYEARVADRDVHLEAMGMYLNLYDRVTTPAGFISNRDTSGYGAGASIIAQLVPKKLDLQLRGIYGRGIGRYGASQLPGATINFDGSLRPIEEVVGLAGLTLHATPAIDVYAFGGIEKELSGRDPATGQLFAGGGAVDNSGCFIQGGNCNGPSQTVWQVTGGFWDKLYSGSFGEVRAGVQYSYTNRELFLNPAQPQFGRPKTDEHMVFTSFRYYPFEGRAPEPVIAKY